ncbi:TusE/DsrC/DsvC family sulfur relay protein [Moraxella atlantae]|uniref:TusE/DsrC/DsvC family sulfur relay protein n=1 Tax=Faucicola atlantae TaxID=34059 RepID=UPI003751811A
MTDAHANLSSLPKLDSDGHLVNVADWSPQVAQILADTLAVHLTDTHLAVLAAVREYYARFSHPPMTRPLIKYLHQTLPELELNNAKLQQLFNTGLIARHVNRLAGLPKPANCL